MSRKKSFVTGALLLVFAPLAAFADIGLVSYTKCTVDGYRVGTSKSAMIAALGRPLPPLPSDPNDQPIDIMHHGFDYEGLVVIFGPTLDKSWGFRILAEGFQLESGIGVGSSEQEVFGHYGPTDEVVFDSVKIIPYQVTWKEGRPSVIHLDFTIVDGVVSRIDVHPRGKEINIEIGHPPY